MVYAVATSADDPGETWCFDAFNAAVSRTFVPLLAEAGDDKSFTGVIAPTELGPLHLAEVTAGAHLIRRTSRLIRSADADYYKLSLQLEGRCVLTQDGRDTVLAPGDLVVYDTTRPYGLRFDDPFRMIVLMFPRPLLQVPQASMRLMTGHRIPGDHGLGMLIGPFLTGLVHQADRCASSVSMNLCDAVLDMLTATLANELGCSERPPHGPRQAALLARIKSYIEDQLTNPDLGPAAIAAAHHISPRYLRKLFEAEGDSVARWVRTRRLERCRHDLTRPEHADLPVSAVATRWCLTDAAHFSRLFKATYGRSPREYRHAALAPSGAALTTAG
jgi:AraC-like DNA-binding protein